VPKLDFTGKQHIYAHHLTVPYRPLVPDLAKSVNPSGVEDNLIIHGDNLYALKALLPRYAGRVKCIYIDPPYNTGNEGWIYNDKVNSPILREWFQTQSPVDGEDLERHDKWLCMLWPRLQLLKELLADDGVIFVSIDDNEQHHLRMLMDDIFGAGNFIAQIVVQTNPRGRSLRRDIAQTHEYVLMYAKDTAIAEINKMPKSERALSEYNRRDETGSYRLLRLRNTGVQFFNRETRPNLFFPIYVNPSSGVISLSEGGDFSVEVLPVTDEGIEGCWTWGKEKIEENPGLVVGQKVRGDHWRIYRKDYLEGESLLTRAKSLLTDTEVNHEVGREMVNKILPGSPFAFPKSTDLVARLISLACKADGVVLDSFAGSGTTAQAVLALNQEDGGHRQFILVECEDYADTITAERVRRVIQGVPNARDKALQEGLGGSFSYCTLGDPIDVEGMLTGTALPEWSALAAYLLYNASGLSVGPGELTPQNADGLFYSGPDTDYYLLYQPDLAFMESNAAMLNGERARRIGAAGGELRRKAIVYGSGKYISVEALRDLGITFCQLPYEMYRIGR